MIALILRLFDCFSWLLRGLGVDYPQFRAILQTKLMLDVRRPRGAFAQRSNKNRNMFALTLVSLAFMGVFISPLVAKVQSPLVSLTFIHAVIMVMLAMSLLGDYSTVLLDTTDNHVLLPRPVSRRTVLFARLAHIFTYLLLITASLGAATFVVGTIVRGGAFLPAFALSLTLSVGLIVGVVSLAYLVGMRLIPEERLRDLLTYAQIVMLVVVVAGYQLVPRLVGSAVKAKLDLAAQNWIYFCPPTWMAGLVDLALGNRGAAQVVLSIEALLAPVLLLLIVAVLAPTFQPAALEGDRTGSAKRAAAGAIRQRWPAVLARLVARNPAERGAFDLVWRLAGRDRLYKLRVYPGLAFAFVFALIWMLTGPERGQTVTLGGLPQTDRHLILLYCASLAAPAALLHLRFSSQFEAAWIYSALPLYRPGEVLLGAFKAVMVRLMLPTFAVLAAIALVVWGWRVLPDVLLASVVLVLICLIEALLVGRHLPFSESAGAMESSGRTLRSMLLMPIVGGFGLAHYAIRPYPFVVLGAIPIVLLLAFACARLYQRTTWSAIPRAS